MALELAHSFSRVSLGPKFVKSAKRARLEEGIVFDASSSRANRSVQSNTNPDPARAAASHSLPIYITLLIRVK